MDRSTQLFGTEWGVRGGQGIHRWSGTLAHTDAFGLWRTVTPQLNYAIALNNIFRVSLGTGFSVLTVPDESDFEWNIDGGAAVQVRHVTLASLIQVDHISKDPERSIPEAELGFIVTMNESKFGSQSMRFDWNLTDNSGSLKIAEAISPVDWLKLSVAVQSTPFFLSMGFCISPGSTKTGFGMSRHADLGWSHFASFQISKSEPLVPKEANEP